MDKLQSALAQPGLQRLVAQPNLKYTVPAISALTAVFLYGRHCYMEWLSLGEGGVPLSLKGWLFNVSAHLIARRDTRAVPAPYETDPSRAARDKYSDVMRTTSFFGDSGKSTSGTAVPERAGARPDVPGTVVPQRQTTETAGRATVERQNEFLRSLASANPGLFRVAPSGLESPKFGALWLAESLDESRVAWFSKLAPGEVAHVHNEGSVHLYLSLVDAAEVVRRGWGERHKLSGVRDLLPWNYVLVYAPRDGEWTTWTEIVVASARVSAACVGFEGEVVVPE